MELPSELPALRADQAKTRRTLSHLVIKAIKLPHRAAPSN